MEKLSQGERLLLVKALAIAAVVAREQNDHTSCQGMFNLLGRLRMTPDDLFTIPPLDRDYRAKNAPSPYTK